MENNCGNCRYYSVRSLCRRYPPKVTDYSEETGMVTATQPTVDEEDWCGEWASTAGADPNIPI